MNIFKDMAPAIRKETRRVAVMTGTGVLIMWIVFFICHAAMPDTVPFDYRVILGGIGGGAVAVLNFFLMGRTVQAVTSAADEDAARAKMKMSYSRRMLMQMVWVVAAIAAPCFHFVAGIVPLLFPSLGIKFMAAIGKGSAS